MYSQQSADELAETIYRSITEFRGTKLAADDLTLVVLKTC
jgi:serine phosphatase RsbU (regulator of sigma subunit)